MKDELIDPYLILLDKKTPAPLAFSLGYYDSEYLCFSVRYHFRKLNSELVFVMEGIAKKPPKSLLHDWRDGFIVNKREKARGIWEGPEHRE